MSTPKVVIILVAYEPDRAMLRNWSEAVSQGVPLRIWDNTPHAFDGWKDFPNLNVDSAGHNMGLGPAIKCLLTKLHAEKHGDTALYFDQDADWSVDTYQWVMAKNQVSLWNQEADTHRLVGLRGGKQPANLIGARTMFTNGMMLPVGPTLELMNRYDPYFLECVDYQLCYKAKVSGWHLFRLDGCPHLFHDAVNPYMEIKIGAKFYRKRIYPRSRNHRFLLNLLALAFETILRFDFVYLWVFLRNVLTHVTYRTWFNAIWHLRPSVRQI